MKNGWKGSAKGRLAFSPRLLLKNMQLQTWTALLEESRVSQPVKVKTKRTISFVRFRTTL